MKKFKSRKFICGLAAALIAVIGHTAEIPTQVLAYAISALVAYMGIEGAIDFVSVLNAVQKKS